MATWFAALLVMAGGVYFAVSWSWTPEFSVEFERIESDQIIDHSPIEQEMIDSVGCGEVPNIPPIGEAVTTLSGYPLLYACVAAPLFDWLGFRGLALFNVLCTLIAMIVVWKIGVRIWNLRGDIWSVTSLASGNLRSIYGAVKAEGEGAPPRRRREKRKGERETSTTKPNTDAAARSPHDPPGAGACKSGPTEAQPETEGEAGDGEPDASARAGTHPKEPDKEPPAWSQKSITVGLFGLVAMGMYAFNPIVFGEAIRSGARPFAYLLSLLAFWFSMRVLGGKPFPKLPVLVLVLASALVHLPAALIVVPILLIGAFGGSIADKLTFMRKTTANRRRILMAIVVAVIGSFAGTLLANLKATEGAVTEFLNRHFPEFVSATIHSWIEYSEQVFAQLGAMSVKYAPQIAVLSLVPIKSVQDGVIERVMLFYAAGLFAFFTLLFPSGDPAQLYPIMFPVTVLGAIGIVSTVGKYLSVGYVVPELIRFFGLLTAAPLLGTALIWISTEPLNKANEVGNRLFGKDNLVTPYTIAITGIAILGLFWQVRKRFRSQNPDESESKRS